jgi:hypothetical protein
MLVYCGTREACAIALSEMKGNLIKNAAHGTIATASLSEQVGRTKCQKIGPAQLLQAPETYSRRFTQV